MFSQKVILQRELSEELWMESQKGKSRSVLLETEYYTSVLRAPEHITHWWPSTRRLGPGKRKKWSSLAHVDSTAFNNFCLSQIV
jgi:hypothetical protein